MKKLLEKILGIEKDLSKIKQEINASIDNEIVTVWMTKKEWKELYTGYTRWHVYSIRYETYGKGDELHMKLSRLISSF